MYMFIVIDFTGM